MEVAMPDDQLARETVRQWASRNFDDAPLPDARLRKRLTAVAEGITLHPEGSVPERCSTWAETMAAYRLLGNDRLEPVAIITPHAELTRRRCRGRGDVLLVQDWTELTWTYDFGELDLLQHETLALDADGRVLGLLDAQWARDAPEAKTRKERRETWGRSWFWPDAVATVGEAPEGCRFITVADREADDFKLITTCRNFGHGFVIRCQHDRHVNDGSDRLRSYLSKQRVRGKVKVNLPARRAVRTGPPQRRRPKARPAREATLAVRWARVTLDPPRNDPRFKTGEEVWVVWAEEVDPPRGEEAVQWILLCGDAIKRLGDARRMMRWYKFRWKIEELHKAQKTGCRLEQSQLHEEAGFVRLAAITVVVAVRLLELRDAARGTLGKEADRADDPAMLVEMVDWLWIMVVAKLGQVEADQLTPRRFYETLARQGGWLARKSDGPPGWLTLYRGWRKVALLVAGAALFRGPDPPS
jgi:hypothetical protein